MRFTWTIAAICVEIVFLVWLMLLLIGSPATVRDIGTPCREHGGVRQWEPPSFVTPWAQENGIVVCRDGKVGRVR